jgi:excisionase family DNA binding protein
MSDKLSAQQAADELGYHVNHVYRLLASGAMTGGRFGNYWMIDRAEVERVKALQSSGGRFYHGKTRKGNAMEED